MERNVYKYWIEIEGKLPRKRKVTKTVIHVTCRDIDTSEPAGDMVTVQRVLADYHGQHKFQKGAVWRFMRTVVSETTYPDGTVMHWQPMFDVNCVVIAKGHIE